METISQMRKRHQREIRALQRSCRRPGISRWRRPRCATGHSPRFQVKVCTLCGKQVNSRDCCYICRRWVEQHEHKEGPGTETRPWYHAGCLPWTPEELAREEAAWRQPVEIPARPFRDILRDVLKEIDEEEAALG